MGIYRWYRARPHFKIKISNLQTIYDHFPATHITSLNNSGITPYPYMLRIDGNAEVYNKSSKEHYVDKILVRWSEPRFVSLRHGDYRLAEFHRVEIGKKPYGFNLTHYISTNMIKVMFGNIELGDKEKIIDYLYDKTPKKIEIDIGIVMGDKEKIIGRFRIRKHRNVPIHVMPQ